MKCVRCTKEGNGNGCLQLPKHHFVQAEPKLRLLMHSPPPRTGSRAAVVLDCEMVGSMMGRNVMVNDLVRLCAVDFLTGEVLIDIFVKPEHRVVQWRTRVSGVTSDLLKVMKAEGRMVDNWKIARAMLWQFIDANTILIGHSLDNDLSALGMIHNRVVDTAIVTKETVMQNCKRGWSLKKLCEQFLGRAIQTASNGHECMEDTYAAREILLWCLQHPDKLTYWANIERETIVKEMEKRAAEKKERLKKKAEKERKQIEAGGGNGISDSSSDKDSENSDLE